MGVRIETNWNFNPDTGRIVGTEDPANDPFWKGTGRVDRIY